MVATRSPTRRADRGAGHVHPISPTTAGRRDEQVRPPVSAGGSCSKVSGVSLGLGIKMRLVSAATRAKAFAILRSLGALRSSSRKSERKPTTPTPTFGLRRAARRERQRQRIPLSQALSLIAAAFVAPSARCRPLPSRALDDLRAPSGVAADPGQGARVDPQQLAVTMTALTLPVPHRVAPRVTGAVA